MSSEEVRQGVRSAYSAAAENPRGRHPFPVGRAFASDVGYPAEKLRALPAAAVDSFAGVSNVSVFADIRAGALVLDLGCGAGLDALIAAERTGRDGRVIGVDFSDAMLERARAAAADAGLENVEFRRGDAEALPLDDASVDVALVNGIFNLNPNREAILRELARVVRAGGALYAAELILCAPLPEAERRSADNWFA